MHRITNASTKVFTLGHSPDPDDAFMFYAMAKNKIDLRGYRFDHSLEDIQTLNERARRGELHISAISIHAYAYVANKYALLPCGASIGDGYGPVVVRKIRNSGQDIDPREWLRRCVIAVPGELTSAFLTLQLFLGKFDYLVVAFDKVFDAVKSGRADAGLIIHEGQLTYAQSGFEKIVDLGEWWKRETGFHCPLVAMWCATISRQQSGTISAKLFAKVSITAWRIETRRCAIRLPTRAAWARNSPVNSSACM